MSEINKIKCELVMSGYLSGWEIKCFKEELEKILEKKKSTIK
jgi:hypothetical protein